MSLRWAPVIGISAYYAASQWSWRASLLTVFYGGLGMAVSYLMSKQQERLLESSEKVMSKYDEFIQKDFESLQTILINEDATYRNVEEEFLGSLKQKDQHYQSDLPFDYNSSLMMFYHDKEDCFHYYTKCGDVTYPILNSICRGYVIEKKCVQLFKDEQELERMKQEETEPNEESVASESGSDKEEEQEENSRSSVFYFKRFDKKKEKQTKTTQKVIHKFIRKGNLQDYEVDFKPASSASHPRKIINYDSFKAFVNEGQQVLLSDSEQDDSVSESESASDTDL